MKLDTLKATAAETIRHERYAQDMTIDDLCEKASVSVQTLVNIEMGRSRSPHGRTVYRIADALGIDPAELFERHETPA